MNGPAVAISYWSGNHVGSPLKPDKQGGTYVCEICCSRGYLKFDENSLRVCPKSSLHFEQQFQCYLLRFVSKAA